MTDVPAAEQDPALPIDFTRLPEYDMDKVSPEIIARTRKNANVLLQKFDSMTATELARRMGVHDSNLSRWKTDGALSFAMRLLACAGLKVVPADALVYTQPEEFK